MDTKNSNGNGHEPTDDDEAPVSAWPTAERTLRKVTDPDLRNAFQEGLERQREILGEVHRLGGEVSEAFGSIMKELGSISSRQKDDRILLEGVAARVARLDHEGEITREEMRDVRKSADNWRLAADESTQRAIIASKEAAEATISKAEAKAELFVERRAARHSQNEIVVQRKSKPVELVTNNKKVVSFVVLVITAIATYFSRK